MNTDRPASRRARYVAGFLGAFLSACSGEVGDTPGGTTSGAGPTGGQTSGGSSGSAGGQSTGTGTGSGGSGQTSGSGGGSPTTTTTSTGTGGIDDTAPFAPAPGALKRLTTTQFQASLTDLLGNVTISDLEPDSWFDGFAVVGASIVSTSPRGVEQYQTAIDAATTQVFADKTKRDALLGCTPTATDNSCAKNFVTKFGRKAWRFPLTTAQVDRYATLASSLNTTLGDPVEAVRMTANALLQSPYFLYRNERGEAATGNTWWRYTAQEMASRLSYFLTNTMPDGDLFTAADKGDLLTVDGVKAQADRLLKTTRGRQSIGNFIDELFQVTIIAARAKDDTFKAYTPALQSAMAREASSMMQAIVFDRNTDAMEMFTTRQTFGNKDLADLYGAPSSGMTSTSWQAITIPASSPRAGLLGTAGYLSLYASQKEGSPTQRGKFIRTLMMCEDIADPPPDVSTAFADPPAGTVLTRKEKLTIHRTKATCNGCHSLMDPLGLPLETFDAIGAYRATDQGKMLDLTGELNGVNFNGPVELGQTIAKSPEAAACLANNVYRYAAGRELAESEGRNLKQLSDGFESNHHNVRDLMIQIVSSDGFRYVAPAQ